ncbi:hypothetical protein B296_00050883 [Ensete ventricosum]|uniref:DUF4050 domain-containing protein n=1 Tax=Ensete ventricosum TaxID=4639 RepID=A0A426Y962_ENSVE|nr:hypothetical protein B296_00050883 [Ensete ventricosum]
MEKNISISHSLESNFSLAPNTANENMMLPEENPNNLFTNQGWSLLLFYFQSLRNCIFFQLIISWLNLIQEMVDFLVDIWHEEGLYD